jgi:hypothetical protein
MARIICDQVEEGRFVSGGWLTAPLFKPGDVVEHKTQGRGVIIKSMDLGTYEVKLSEPQLHEPSWRNPIYYGEGLRLVPELELLAEEAPG